MTDGALGSPAQEAHQNDRAPCLPSRESSKLWWYSGRRQSLPFPSPCQDAWANSSATGTVIPTPGQSSFVGRVSSRHSVLVMSWNEPFFFWRSGKGGGGLFLPRFFLFLLNPEKDKASSSSKRPVGHRDRLQTTRRCIAYVVIHVHCMYVYVRVYTCTPDDGCYRRAPHLSFSTPPPWTHRK